MKLIIKQPIAKSEWATLYCVGDNACEKGGTISNVVLQKMRSQGIIQVMDPDKLIEKHPKHEELIIDSAFHHYLGIGLDEKYPAIPTIYKIELYCDKCGIVHPINEHIFWTDYDTQIRYKFTTKVRCSKCNDKIQWMERTLENEDEVKLKQEFLKKSGETWTQSY